MILAGDIGGTNSRLALFDRDLRLVRESSYPNSGRSGLVSVVTEFLQAGPPDEAIEAATFGVAGPVRDGRVTLTNLNWDLDERALARELAIARVELINDLRAHAEGIEMLEPDDLIVVNDAPSAQRRVGNRAIIAAGTGLGEAGLVWDSQVSRHHPVACEGGHRDFAPLMDQEIGLLAHLRAQGLPTSWESVLSGPGLRNIYDFVTEVWRLRNAASELVAAQVIDHDDGNHHDYPNGERPVANLILDGSVGHDDQGLGHPPGGRFFSSDCRTFACQFPSSLSVSALGPGFGLFVFFCAFFAMTTTIPRCA
jgi:glucokinase